MNATVQESTRKSARFNSLQTKKSADSLETIHTLKQSMVEFEYLIIPYQTEEEEEEDDHLRLPR